MSDIGKRKLEHIEALEQDKNADRNKFYFDQIKLVHRALPELSLEEINTETEFLGKKMSIPLIISGMTGGNHKTLESININLALACEQAKIAMCVGSQRVVFLDSDAKKSFQLRKFAPKSLLFANLGAVQLNYDFTIDHCKEVVDLLEADALYLHLNPLQEAIQPEGNTDFSFLAKKIEKIVPELSVPVIIKEVGSGISPTDARVLYNAGVRFIDVAGSGGTSWSRVENSRRSNDDLGLLFQDWGIPTPKAIELIDQMNLDITLIASGGVRNGIDIAKAIILGARYVGIAKPFLALAKNSEAEVLRFINQIKKELKIAMFLMGISRIKYLQSNKALVLN